MTKQDFYTWADKFFKAWASLDPDVALSLLSKDVEYYESPFSEPCKNWQDVVDLWRVVPDNQKDITYKYDVIIVEGNASLIHWRLSRVTVPDNKKQEFDGAFLVKLNDKGLCVYFKQWRMIRE